MHTVAIVGRPNVGKSTFFNRLVEARTAIVDDMSGITRDRIYGEAEWNGRRFSVVDTGGYVPNSSDRFEAAIREQVQIAIEEADAILFVLDVTTGITDLDEAVASRLREVDKPVFVIANKADNERRRWESAEFYALGFPEVYPISAMTGSGTGDLLDAVVASLPGEELTDEPDERPRIAFVGRPNVGKSSLTNALLGKDRSIVTEISGTTRDRIDSVLQYHGREIVLIDTAGLRRKARVTENIEFYSQLRTDRAIQECEVAVLLLDGTQGLEAQDIRVLKQAEQLNKGILIAVNKWDLVDKETNTARNMENAIHERLRTLTYVPIVFVSALTGQRVHKLLDRALVVVDERNRRVSTSELNEVILAAAKSHPPPMERGMAVTIKYATQVRAAPPVFAVFSNRPKAITENYRRYLENKVRSTFGFEGVPIVFSFRKS